jgi:hypothetical protein
VVSNIIDARKDELVIRELKIGSRNDASNCHCL